MKCAKIQIAIKQRGTRSGNKYLTYNGINAFYFQKLHVEKWKDVPNKFVQDCSLIANCSDGSIRMNGLPKPDLVLWLDMPVEIAESLMFNACAPAGRRIRRLK